MVKNLDVGVENWLDGLVGERGVKGEVISGREVGVGRGMLFRGKPKEGGDLEMGCGAEAGSEEEAHFGGKVKLGSFLLEPMVVFLIAKAIVRS